MAKPLAGETLSQAQLREKHPVLYSDMAGFIGSFRDLLLSDVVVLPSDARRIPRNIDKYSLAWLSVQDIKYDYQGRIVRRVYPPFGVQRSQSFADADYAMGLIKLTDETSTSASSVLCATICMGVSATTGKLLITQIQGARFRENDLRAGFLWRHTLVAGMAALALMHNQREIELISATNNRWNPNPAGYDGVAAGLGFQQDPHTKNWTSTLPLAFDPATLPPMHKRANL